MHIAFPENAEGWPSAWLLSRHFDRPVRCKNTALLRNVFASFRCETCSKEEAKYRCPRCMKYSCRYLLSELSSLDYFSHSHAEHVDVLVFLSFQLIVCKET